MQLMNLSEWSKMDVAGKNDWLNAQARMDLEHILAILGELLEHADDLDAQIAMLPPSEDINTAREFTYNTLRDMEKCIVIALVNKEAYNRITV